MNLSISSWIAPWIFCASMGSPAHAQSPSEIKASSEEYRQYMVRISRQLGVTCNACHNSNNFASDEKAAFKVAKSHIKIVQILIDAGMNGQKGQPKADCYLCHRGKLKPDYKEPFDPMTMRTQSKDQTHPSGKATEDQE